MVDIVAQPVILATCCATGFRRHNRLDMTKRAVFAEVTSGQQSEAKQAKGAFCRHLKSAVSNHLRLTTKHISTSVSISRQPTNSPINITTTL
jgi:hypothetical protein